MHESVFREYDIRGKVPQELDPSEMYSLGQAIAYFLLKESSSVKVIIVGMDGREHSPILKDALCKALIDSGLHVIFIGICPSPVMYFGLFTTDADAGLMITASHNPPEYNGIKIMLGKKSIWGNQIREIGQFYKERKSITPASIGTYREGNLNTPYIEYLKNAFPSLINMPLKAIIDCGNGAGGAVLPQLVHALNWKHVHLLYPEIDGITPHHEADPTVPENMMDVRDLLATTDAQIGIGLDGDADRMAAITKSGFLVPGDQLLAVFADSLRKGHPDLRVVFDAKSSGGLIDLLTGWDVHGYMSRSGHAIIKQEMIKNDALLGGELSCHFVFADRYFGFDDGVYAMMRLFEIIITTGKTLEELLSIFPKKFSSPEYRISCQDNKKEEIITRLYTHFIMLPDTQVVTIDGVRVIKKYGWGIVRASNTQPVLSMRFESDTQKGLTHIKNDFKKILSDYYSAHELAVLS